MAKTHKPLKFSAADFRRVAAAFDEAVPAPFIPAVSLSDDAKRIHAIVKAPNHPNLTVVEATFLHNSLLKGEQPSKAELESVAKGFHSCCESYGTR